MLLASGEWSSPLNFAPASLQLYSVVSGSLFRLFLLSSWWWSGVAPCLLAGANLLIPHSSFFPRPVTKVSSCSPPSDLGESCLSGTR